MATQKKSTTRGKTKTAKTPVSKKTVSKKLNTAKKRRVNLASLRRLMLISLPIYVLVGAAAIWLMAPTYFDVTAPYQTTDPLSKDGSLLAAYRHLYTFDLRWLIVALSAVSLLFTTLYLTSLQNFYNQQIQKKQLWTRWIEMALVGGLTLEGIVLLSGWAGIIEIKFAVFIAVAIAFLGYLQENQVAETSRQSRDLTVAIKLTKLAFLLLVAFTALMTFVYGLTTTDWNVYALYAGLVAGFVVYGRHYSKLATAPALQFEYKSQVLSLITRVGFSALIIAGLLK
jgi:hypothetical protein